MAVITLTSDLGYKDNYVALVKSVILRESPDSTIIDICHEIEKFNIVQAAYLFGNAFHHFPKHSVHILGVKAPNTRSERFLIIDYKDQLILCPDNGIFTLFYDHTNAKVYELNINETESEIFFIKDILAPAACKLANGAHIDELGKIVDDYLQLLSFQPTSTPDSIIGRCLYIDSFGNVITNITKEFFEQNRKGRSFHIHVPGHRITEISSTYDDVTEISALALFNTSGYLEIAINKGQARQLLFPKNINIHTDFNISIEFDE